MRRLKEILRVRRNDRAADPVPGVLQINITSRCPCRCWHCELGDADDGVHMDLAVLRDWLEQAAQWDCTVLYSGGEPLAHPRWREALELGHRLGLRQKLITSGAGLPARGSEGRALLDVTLVELLVSLDSADPERHDALRGVPGLHARIMNLLEDPARTTPVWLIHVPPPDFAGVGEMVDLAARHGAGLSVQPYIFDTNFPGRAAHPDKAARRADLPGLADLAERRAADQARRARVLGVPSNLAATAALVGPYYRRSTGGEWFGSEVLPDFRCSVPWQQAVVDELGRVQPCTFLPGEAPPPGVAPGEHWRAQALAHRREIEAGRVWPQCFACSCHFGANHRNSLLRAPWANRRAVAGLVLQRLGRRFGGRA